jgi:hypothetical protein
MPCYDATPTHEKSLREPPSLPVMVPRRGKVLRSRDMIHNARSAAHVSVGYLLSDLPIGF